MDELIERIKFAWHVIWCGIPPEFKVPKLDHYITEHRIDTEQVFVEYEVNEHEPHQFERSLQNLGVILQPFLKIEEFYKPDVESGEIVKKLVKRLTIKVAVER